VLGGPFSFHFFALSNTIFRHHTMLTKFFTLSVITLPFVATLAVAGPIRHVARQAEGYEDWASQPVPITCDRTVGNGREECLQKYVRSSRLPVVVSLL